MDEFILTTDQAGLGDQLAALSLAFLERRRGRQAVATRPTPMSKTLRLIVENWGIMPPLTVPLPAGHDEGLVLLGGRQVTDFGLRPEALGAVKAVIGTHFLQGLTTTGPLDVRLYPFASTSTVVYQLYLADGVALTPMTAGLLLSGLLLDLDPTKPGTAADQAALHQLAQLTTVALTDYRQWLQKISLPELKKAGEQNALQHLE